MKISSIIWVALVFGGQPALAQVESSGLPKSPGVIEQSGALLDASSMSTLGVPSETSLRSSDDLPLKQLSDIANHTLKEVSGGTRSAKDAELYRSISPSVVLIVTKDSLGSGSLVSSSGDILTNWRVISGATNVGIVFKPAIEGRQPRKDDIKAARVVKYDPVADLALIRAVEAPKGRTPIRIGDGSNISVGIDVHAIGHPRGESWTYTKGIVSQYRLGFDWVTDSQKHRADVIQTQTPISPGNSGGPLLDDNGTLLGVNTFKEKGEALNFAVSADDVKKFIGRTSGTSQRADIPKTTCEAKVISKFRNTHNTATVISYDTRCGGKADTNYTVPDSMAEAITLTKDRNGDGRIDVMYFDLKHRLRWDLSFWDESFGGRWTLVGYHSDGGDTPTEFESYDTFQKRTASR